MIQMLLIYTLELDEKFLLRIYIVESLDSKDQSIVR